MCFHVLSSIISLYFAAFAPVESNFGRHDLIFRSQDDSNFAPTDASDDFGSHGQRFGHRSDRSYQNSSGFENQCDSRFQNESSCRNQCDSASQH